MNEDDIHITGDECIIDVDSHSLFHELVVDDILDPAIHPNNKNMDVCRTPSKQQGPQRMQVVDPIRKLCRFSGNKTGSAKILDAFDDYLEIWQINVVDTKEAQIINMFVKMLAIG